MSQIDQIDTTTQVGRNTVVAGSVLALHIAALWAIQAGMGKHTLPEVITPVQLISEFITSAPPAAPPTPPAPPVPTPPPPKPTPPKPAPTPPKPKAQLPAAIKDPTPSPNAPTGSPDVISPTPPAPPAPPAPPVAAPSPAPAAPVAPAAPKIELPSSNAAYLNNPSPTFPAVSRRLGEQGKVTLRVLISAQGLPERVELAKSSGFERLDNAAIDTVKRWKFVPGKRNGVAEAMEYLVPVNFVLQQ
ncbi:energy transducer TonB [Diaphorobacter sp. HDW4A]|uniref:energy transducer TonB n=1 Tax=Diaphorobacter sp. HDW4A TaxID=2714924 RepID=UPI0014075E11|nr:energy transducer TonB [Diaphorobacter sp. HDW4A]QIL79224.1 energy transducer TonB [Diaphorobacter sp. HDW4A]